MSGARILVVDDMPDNRGLLVQLLRREGHQVSEAANGREALERIAADRPELMLLDLMMPVMDGFEVLDAMRDDPGPFLPIVVVSAASEREARMKALGLGAHEFLLKPVDAEELQARVQTLLALREARAAAERRAEDLEVMVAERTRALIDAQAQLRERAVAAEEAKRQLARAYAELETFDRFKDDLLAIISHEFRTPLNAILGFSSNVDDELLGPLNEAQHQHMAEIFRAVEQLTFLVNNLVAMSRLTAGKLRLELSDEPLGPVVEAAASALRPQADRKGLSLEFDLSSLGEVRIDCQAIMQVVANLVDNAVKFSPEGGRIAISGLDCGDEVRVAVSDQGPGIAHEQLGRLFTSFAQLDMTSTREAGGLGLGLSLSKAIVEAHGGKIGLESPLGQGTTVWFRLPKPASAPMTGAAEGHGRPGAP